VYIQPFFFFLYVVVVVIIIVPIYIYVNKTQRAAFLEDQVAQQAKNEQTKTEISTKYAGLREKYRDK
jgi:uncharacterized membrane protein